MGDYFNPIVGAYRVSSPFGSRSSPGGIGSTEHMGLDLAAPLGTPVVAPTDITILEAGRKGGFGNFISGQDSAGNIYQFGHLSEINVSPGNVISGGSVIGAVGSTGNSTGNHLHFGIKDANGNFINPSSLIAGARKIGKDALNKGKSLIGKALTVAALSNPVTAPLVIGAKLAGVGGDSWLDQFKKWLKESGFFQRMAMVIIAVIFLMAAFSLLARGQVSFVKSLKGN